MPERIRGPYYSIDWGGVSPSDPNPNLSARRQELNQIITDLKQFKDSGGTPIDAGIIDTVGVLNAFGIETFSSCEGHLDGLGTTYAPYIGIGKVLDPQTRYAVYKPFIDATLDLHNYEQQNPSDTAGIAQKKADIRIIYSNSWRPYLQHAFETRQLIEEYYQSHQPVSEAARLILEGNESDFHLRSASASIQAYLDPSQRAQRLQEFQQEMKAFTLFVGAKFLAKA
jgi:hypothetical protein